MKPLSLSRTIIASLLEEPCFLGGEALFYALSNIALIPQKHPSAA